MKKKKAATLQFRPSFSRLHGIGVDRWSKYGVYTVKTLKLVLFASRHAAMCLLESFSHGTARNFVTY